MLSAPTAESPSGYLEDVCEGIDSAITGLCKTKEVERTLESDTLVVVTTVSQREADAEADGKRLCASPLVLYSVKTEQTMDGTPSLKDVRHSILVLGTRSIRGERDDIVTRSRTS